MITIGRIVLYVISKSDAEQINRRLTTGTSISERIQQDKWPLGSQAHIGNTVSEGEAYPAMAVNIFNPIQDNPPVNFQVFLDGNDTFWATSIHEDAAKTPGTYHWPTRQ